MSRWKQTFTCKHCGHSAWREVETEDFVEPDPDTAQLERRGFKCGACKSRTYTVTQEKLLPKHFDAMRPGGLRIGLVGFSESAAEDARRGH